MKTLPGQVLRPEDFRDVERQLLAIFKRVVFDPIVDIVCKTVPVNRRQLLANAAAEDALTAALRSGRVMYADGVFCGSFNAEIAVALRKGLGADFDRRRQVYRLDPAAVPTWAKIAAADYRARSEAMHQQLVTKLDEIQAQLAAYTDRERVDARLTVDRVDAGWKQAAKKLELMPDLTAESRAKMAEEYSANMELWVNDFTQKMIVQLRGDVQSNALQGYRSDALVELIRRRYRVTARKAEFLAEQETRLFMSRFRERRAADIGSGRYVWRTSKDARVRHDHRALDGTVQFYAHPPIVDVHTGRRGNPGSDYGCRCIDETVIEDARSGVRAPARSGVAA
ncbi:MAG: minor capsid protein [Elusimicrobia bacterium]|nr:minor capsid protein [Elusimicrobiota bacterium]